MNTHITPGRLKVLIFTLLYTVGAGGYFALQGNFEFLWYVLVMALIAGIIGATLPKTQFPDWVLWLLSIWGLLHMAGGGVPVGDSVLYRYMVWPIFDGGGDFVFFKYDQLVHAYGFGVAALATQSILSRTMASTSGFWIAFTAALVSMGLSVVNEIVEFVAVIIAPDTGVGDFYNLELDLVFNTLGAIVAVLLYQLIRKA